MTTFRRGVASILLAWIFFLTTAVPALAAAPKAYEAKPFPKTGLLTEADDSDFGILKINGPEDSSTYIKIYRYNAKKKAISGEPVKTLFIRSGKSLTLDMPRGNYLLRYCTGKRWYGEEEMFGTRDAFYSEADKVLQFSKRDEGYEITLKFVSNGNLSSTKVAKEVF